jgi:hypothetical protein
MYCQSCGGEYAIGLPYCNRCGANLNTAFTAATEPAQVSVTKPALIIGIVITLLTLGGFGMLIGGAIELARSPQMGSDPLIAMIVVGMTAIMATDFFLVRLLSKLIDASLKSSGRTSPKSISPPANAQQFSRLSTAQLTPAPSVTEHTTRFFEPAYRAPAEAEGVDPLKNSEK